MRIAATVTSSADTHAVRVRTGDATQIVPVPRKAAGPGSGINGGEFLMLALATCYCNDLYREAQRLGVAIDHVEVNATAEFSGIGLAASDITYTARIQSAASAELVQRLLRETDAVAEVHNTLRAGLPVRLIE